MHTIIINMININATQVKNKLYSLIASVNENNEIISITSKKGNTIAYNETIALYKTTDTSALVMAFCGYIALLSSTGAPVTIPYLITVATYSFAQSLTVFPSTNVPSCLFISLLSLSSSSYPLY